MCLFIRVRAPTNRKTIVGHGVPKARPPGGLHQLHGQFESGLGHGVTYPLWVCFHIV
jgi:hypothetical protein